MAATAIHMHVYVSSLCRAGPYVLGVAAGWYLRHLRARRKPPPRALSWLLLPLGLLTLAVVLAGSVFYPPLVAAPPPRWVHVLYAGTYRTACALSYAAALVVAAARDHSGKAESTCCLAPAGQTVPLRASLQPTRPGPAPSPSSDRCPGCRTART